MGLLDVFHHAAEEQLLSVIQRVHINPPITLSQECIQLVRESTEAIASGVGVRGLLNRRCQVRLHLRGLGISPCTSQPGCLTRTRWPPAIGCMRCGTPTGLKHQFLLSFDALTGQLTGITVLTKVTGDTCRRRTP